MSKTTANVLVRKIERALARGREEEARRLAAKLSALANEAVEVASYYEKALGLRPTLPLRMNEFEMKQN